MKKITLRQIANACSGEYVGDEKVFDTHICGIAIDNRKIEQDYLFIPIIGERFDGHSFIESSFENGAICSLTEQDIKDDNNYIKVESTFQALKDIAEFYRSLFDVKVIGITGSVGKTTAKEFIYSVLSQKYNVLKSEKNFNNEIGVPLTLFQLRDEHDFAVVEMGMNHFGEISRLSKTAHPDICIITNIAYTHVGHLGSREGIFKAKCEIFDYAKENCKTYLNGDDDLLLTLKNKIKNITFFGFEKYNDVTVENIKALGLKGSKGLIKYRDDRVSVCIEKPGVHLLYSAMLAVAVGIDMGLSSNQIEKGINEFEPADNRMEAIRTKKLTILNDVYNASPKSVRAAIDVLKNCDGRKVCILGDMLELGEYSEKLHFEVGKYAEEKGIDVIVSAGEFAKNTIAGADKKERGLYCFDTQDEMINNLKSIIKEGDTILVKASRGMKFERTVEQLKIL